jgi:serine/threonine protein kinase
MGTVYRASHAMLRRPTAIKLLRPGKSTALDLARFEREVQLTSELTHPNTVAIFDYGRSPDGQFYYAMEYLGGTDLESLVRNFGPQPANRVVHIIQQVCGALDEAHSRDFIHRDIKPANILLCQRGRDPDVAKVVDFGLVKEIGREGISGTNIIAGTPAYLSPEAVTHPDKLGPASDIYALGAVMYFLLTGKPVFAGATPVDVCLNQVEKTPTPPSRQTDNPIPGELEDIVMQCLTKDPAKRPESALALRTALDTVPRTEDWDRDTALEWWAEFEAEEVETGSAPRTIVSSPATMTVDLRGRSAVAQELAEAQEEAEADSPAGAG